MNIHTTKEKIILKNLNIVELYKLFTDINKYKLVLRDELLLSNDFYFSPEIEFASREEESARKLFQKELDDRWKMTWESTIGNGYELKPVTYLTNTKEDYKEIGTILNKIEKDLFSSIDYRCGLHINIGAHIFDNDEHFDKFMFLWLAYEEIIYRFLYGDFYNPRKGIERVAYPFRIGLENLNIDELYEEASICKTGAFCTRKISSYDYEYNNVLEIRCPNSTLNPIVVQNNVNMLGHMIEYSRKNIDTSELINMINNKLDIEFEDYNKIYINESLDFADKIFDNNLDKIYFLKQYMKDGKEVKYNPESNKMIKYKKL